MAIIDTKIINTENGMELYRDELPIVTFKDIHYPLEDELYYEITIGVNYFRIRPEHYYEGETGYFKIRMNESLSDITIIETDRGSLFAIKNLKEREETKMLIAEWLFTTSSFKKEIHNFIISIMMDDKEIKDRSKQAVKFLMKVQQLQSYEILNAAMKKEKAQPFCWAV